MSTMFRRAPDPCGPEPLQFSEGPGVYPPVGDLQSTRHSGVQDTLQAQEGRDNYIKTKVGRIRSHFSGSGSLNKRDLNPDPGKLYFRRYFKVRKIL